MPTYDVIKSSAPTIFVIFGATGDLTRQKLIPSLFDLYARGLLPDKFRIVGFSRREFSDDAIREYFSQILKDKKNHSSDLQSEFLKKVHYHQGNFDIKGDYERLNQTFSKIDGEFGQCSNKLFYLAVPPTLYETILRSLSDSKLTIPCDDGLGWTRILVEKPFGNNSKTARKLDTLLGKLFKEEQIFRIDHYLAKETIQNILTFRFANAFIQPAWSRKYIESVHVKLYESKTAEERGAFYDGVGAIRDVGQNHLLQMLALVAMDQPKDLSAREIRKNRARIMRKVSLMSKKSLLRGQYEGFKNEKGVAPDSETETYFNITAKIKTSRWKGVPFILEAGKGLSESKAEITVYFKSDAIPDFTSSEERECFNALSFHIQPVEGISILFWVKRPGFGMELDQRPLSFKYDENLKIPDAYERVLYDCIRGHQTLFASTEEVEAEWDFITPILQKISTFPLRQYEVGSSPESVKSLFD